MMSHLSSHCYSDFLRGNDIDFLAKKQQEFQAISGKAISSCRLIVHIMIELREFYKLRRA